MAGGITLLSVLELVLIAPVLAYSGGSGTPGDPYQISNAADWGQMIISPSDWDKNFVLVSDICLTGFTQLMVGTKDNLFVGVLDGNGHIIACLDIFLPNSDEVGLFGSVGSSGRILNLGLVDSNVQGRNGVGGLVGVNRGMIQSCFVVGTVAGSGDEIGGLVGRNSNGTIRSCYTMGSVSGQDWVGGLVGNNWAGSIADCYASGTVTVFGSYGGGLIGMNKGYVVSSFWDIQISGQSTSAGGKGLTTVRMKTVSTYQNAGWADKGWVLDEGKDTPRLSWENVPGILIPLPVIPLIGSGTEADPYLIYSGEEFAVISEFSSLLDKQIRLMTDLDLTGIELHPIGTVIPFTGIFDGNGHTLRNPVLHQSGWDDLGLFGRIGPAGQVRNLKMLDADIVGRNIVGGLAARNEGAVEFCSIAGFIKGDYVVGGLLGYNYGTVTASCSSGQVEGYGWVGGLVGWNDVWPGTSGGTITACFTKSFVNGIGDDIGGLAGVNYGVVSSCYTNGPVKGFRLVGGLIGLNSGLAMFSYSTGVIQGDYEVGGLAGTNESRGGSGLVSSSFWDYQLSRQMISGGGKGLTTDQTKSLSIYQNAGWAGKGWVIEDKKDTPRLSWENTPGIAISPPTIPLEGSGTEADPYRIRSAEDFAKMSWYSALLDKHIRLMTDLDLRGVTLYPIGDTKPFSGVFDGGGHILYNASVNERGRNFVGLFSRIGPGGRVKNLGVVDVRIVGQYYVGGLVAQNEGEIESCYADGSINGKGNVGALVGANGIGGSSSAGSVVSSYAEGAINGNADDVGGLAGTNYGWIRSSFSAATVFNTGNRVGGLVGWNHNSILSCYAVGEVAGDSGVGGLVGTNDSGTIISCYASGKISGINEAIGGLVGANTGSVVSSFWDIQTSGQAFSEGGTGLTTIQMWQSMTFIDAGWDYSSADGTPAVWKVLQEGKSYPILAWQPRVSTGYSGGDGTSADPFHLADADDLLMLSNSSKDWNKAFILTADIDLREEVFNRAPIAPDVDDGREDFQGIKFTGTFDGNNHRILNLNLINEINSSYLGLFGYLDSARIENLRLEGVLISAAKSSYVGSLAGFTNDCWMRDCSSTGTVVVDPAGDGYYVGGMIGYNNAGSISFCCSQGIVSGWNIVGGLVGQNDGPMVSCWSRVDVMGNYDVGGLVGYQGDQSLIFSYATGSVNGRYSIGGLVGLNMGIINSCFAESGATATAVYGMVGGLVGANGGTISLSYASGQVDGVGQQNKDGRGVGGLVGYNMLGYISSCYSTGSVVGSGDSVGGFVGNDEKGTVNSCFWDLQTSGQTRGSVGIGLTTEKMKEIQTFIDAQWDFVGESANGSADIWRLCVEGINYPILAWQSGRFGDNSCPNDVGMEDLMYLSDRWFGDVPGAADADLDGRINLSDFAILSHYWLKHDYEIHVGMTD
ncbi:MAG: hypothetical protein GX455_12510 [Phycisphaerae bacterium]|nr:hypothetical protein [Phycisphaerae bacterium]